MNLNDYLNSSFAKPSSSFKTSPIRGGKLNLLSNGLANYQNHEQTRTILNHSQLVSYPRRKILLKPPSVTKAHIKVSVMYKDDFTEDVSSLKDIYFLNGSLNKT